MSRQITTTVYTFNELSEKAKEKAINSLSDINIDYDWWDCIYEDAKNVEIIINSFDLDRNRHCKTDISNPVNTAQLIIENHGEDCETYKTAFKFLQSIKPLIDKLEKGKRIEENYSYSKSPTSYRLSYYLDKLRDNINNLSNDFKKEITEDYSIVLQKECDYLQSEEAIVETILANEYEFTEEGELI